MITTLTQDENEKVKAQQQKLTKEMLWELVWSLVSAGLTTESVFRAQFNKEEQCLDGFELEYSAVGVITYKVFTGDYFSRAAISECLGLLTITNLVEEEEDEYNDEVGWLYGVELNFLDYLCVTKWLFAHYSIDEINDNKNKTQDRELELANEFHQHCLRLRDDSSYRREYLAGIN